MGLGVIAALVVAAPASAAIYDNFAAANEFGPFDLGEPQYGTEYGNSVGATKEAGEPNHAGFAGGASVWWYFEPTTAGAYLLTTCLPVGTSDAVDRYDSLLAVYTGSAVNALTEVASNDDGNGGQVGRDCSNGLSYLEFTGAVGTRYYLVIDSKSGIGLGTGDVTLTLELKPEDTQKPKVRLTKKPAPVVRSNAAKVTARFEFKGSDDVSKPGALEYRCKLDGGSFKPCTSPFSKKVGRGSHTFAVKATDAAGKTSKTVSYSWQVKRA